MSFDFDPTKINSVLPELSREQLQEIVLQQAALVQKLQAKVVELEAQIEELKEQPPTSNAPFRIPPHKRSLNPKRPGRKKGHKGNYRLAKTPTEIINVPLECCPRCDSVLERIKNITQTIEEIPIIEPRVIQIETMSGYCKKCKRRVRSSHPIQVSRAVGAASVSLGPQALSVACELQHRFHLTKSKTVSIMKEIFGIRITRGGLVNLTHRVAKRLEPQYTRLVREVQHSKVIHADETGWYVGSVGNSLCVFTNKLLTLYKITASRTRAFVSDILGDYQGVLVTDCLSIYDDLNEKQQKCYSHHLKAIRNALNKHPEGKSDYLKEVRLMLETAMSLKSVKALISTQEFKQKLECLQEWSNRLLLKPRVQPQEEAVRLRLYKQRDHLFEFLKHLEVDATNNHAERQLRPAVIARKLSCGNRTEKGARSWEILQSLSVTASQRNQSFKELIMRSTVGVPP